MKILYISGNQRSPQFPWLTDYQDDCLLLGLKELFGDDVVDCNKRFHLYSDYPDDLYASEYGKGFTICRNLTSDNTDREDIIRKIKNKFFDLVVYGSIWRCQDHLQIVLDSYDKKQIIYVDGEDTNLFHDRIKDETIYFKRELYPDQKQANLQEFMKNVLPIQFAMPTNKVTGGAKKERRIAYIDPRNKSTYTYNTEVDYYQDYKFSKFGRTTRKAGWDCMRHYEIMANGCVPIFEEIANCPRFSMMRAPKALWTKIAFFEKNDPKWIDKNYEYFQQEIMDHLLKYNTTVKNAEHFIKEIKLHTK